ncbi:prenyltransferase [Arsukibacterium ikkense]|uniref:Cell division coordinator CpoB n=1 Tax=Arsukibacterium ikkense TaxID=336831 RepID=A0A0M2V806_9GAMM|nr:tol-pal system protein YbgF [Arsukibacterium ikkense]KKO45785.1 prenyltransferase [Arsukibacterium ikkense]
MTVNKTLWIALSLVSIGAWANPAPVTELGRNTTSNQQLASTGTLEQRLATLERVVEARAQGQLQMQQQLQILLDEVSQLRGVTETHTYQLEEMVQRQRDLYQEIDRRVGALQSSTSAQPAVASNVNNVPTVSYSSNMSENDAYDKAVNMVLKDRRYDAAIPEFEAFLKSYPDSTYAPNAHYWLGQLLFNNNELAKAKTHFERVIANYATSNKVPDALLKLGQVAERENNKDAALRFYRRLTSEHASATSARLAQERIDALK